MYVCMYICIIKAMAEAATKSQKSTKVLWIATLYSEYTGDFKNKKSSA